MNLVLGDVVETIYLVEEDGDEEEIRVREAITDLHIPETDNQHRPRRRSRRCCLFEVSVHLVAKARKWYVLTQNDRR